MEPFQHSTKYRFSTLKFIGQLILLILAEIILFIITHRTANTPATSSNQNRSSLVFVQVLFRHGERTPMASIGPYPNDPYMNYTYEPYGPGALTEKGKRREFELGKYLRRYYHDFLGEYHKDIVYAKSSAMVRCQHSLLLVLAGLFPPPKSLVLQDDLNWQPITYDHTKLELDMTFLHFFHCKKFLSLLAQQYLKPDVIEEVKKYKELFRKLEMHSGAKVRMHRDAFSLYTHLLVQQEYGLELPRWTDEFMPKPLEDFEEILYNMSCRTDELKRLSGGFLLGEIINSVSSKISDPKLENRRIHLYAGHDMNIAILMGTLGISVPKRMPYGSFFSFELHKTEKGFALKLLLYDGTTELPKVLVLKECQELCPLNKFVNRYSKYVTTPDKCNLDQETVS